MKKMYIVSALVVCGAMGLTAQDLNEYSELPKLGDVHTLLVFDANGISVSGGGQGQTWDYSSLAKTDSFDLQVVDPKLEPEGGSYADADIAIKNNYMGSNNHSGKDLNIHYFKVTANKLIKIGRVDKARPTGGSIIWINKFDNEENYLQMPLKFGTKHSDTWSGGFTSLGSPVTWSNGTNTYEVDGEGILKLPGKTLNNVLRVKRIRKYTTSSRFGTGPVEKIVYEWYVPKLPFPVLTIVEQTNASGGASRWEGYVLAEKEYKNIQSGSNPTGIENFTQTNSFSVFPNPVSGQFTVFAHESISRLALVSMNGQKVLELQNMEPHENSLVVSTSHLEPGVYILQMSNSSAQTQTHRIVIE
jgi:hypothetical protein